MLHFSLRRWRYQNPEWFWTLAIIIVANLFVVALWVAVPAGWVK